MFYWISTQPAQADAAPLLTFTVPPETQTPDPVLLGLSPGSARGHRPQESSSRPSFTLCRPPLASAPPINITGLLTEQSYTADTTPDENRSRARMHSLGPSAPNPHAAATEWERQPCSHNPCMGGRQGLGRGCPRHGWESSTDNASARSSLIALHGLLKETNSKVYMSNFNPRQEGAINQQPYKSLPISHSREEKPTPVPSALKIKNKTAIFTYIQK